MYMYMYTYIYVYILIGYLRENLKTRATRCTHTLAHTLHFRSVSSEKLMLHAH